MVTRKKIIKTLQEWIVWIVLGLNTVGNSTSFFNFGSAPQKSYYCIFADFLRGEGDKVLEILYLLDRFAKSLNITLFWKPFKPSQGAKTWFPHLQPYKFRKPFVWFFLHKCYLLNKLNKDLHLKLFLVLFNVQ